MKRKLIAMGLIAVFSMSILAGCGGGSKDDKAAAKDDKKVVTVGTNAVFEPFEYQNEAGEIVGFDIDLMKAIGEDQGFEVKVENMEFDALTGSILNGSIDVVAAGMSITPDRLEKLAFTKPYLDASLGIVVEKDNAEIKSVEDLKGKVVSAQIGTTGADASQELVEKGGAAEVKIFDNFTTCVQSLLNGSVDAIINDMPVNEIYMEKHPGDVEILGEPFVADYYGIAVAKDNKALLEKLNKGFDNIVKNGKYEELCKKYDLPVNKNIIEGKVEVSGNK